MFVFKLNNCRNHGYAYGMPQSQGVWLPPSSQMGPQMTMPGMNMNMNPQVPPHMNMNPQMYPNMNMHPQVPPNINVNPGVPLNMNQPQPGNIILERQIILCNIYLRNFILHVAQSLSFRSCGSCSSTSRSKSCRRWWASKGCPGLDVYFQPSCFNSECRLLLLQFHEIRPGSNFHSTSHVVSYQYYLLYFTSIWSNSSLFYMICNVIFFFTI